MVNSGERERKGNRVLDQVCDNVIQDVSVIVQLPAPLLTTVQVLLPIPADSAYSYCVPDGMSLMPGDVVLVPLGNRKVPGVVWEGDASEIAPEKLRSVLSKFKCPPIDKSLRKFIDWMASYTLTPPGMVLKMVLRVPVALEPEAPLLGVRATGKQPDRMTGARKNVIDLSKDGAPWTRANLAKAAGVSVSVVEGLSKQGVFEPVEMEREPVVALPVPDHGPVALEAEQSAAAVQLQARVEEGVFSVSLLEGMTGSGKTEVYFEVIAQALRQNRQVLVLLPEIALTASFLDRFERRFGARPAEWHTDITPRQRERIWRQVATGAVRVVVGARSALFLPFIELGLIVVDEEHDLAYKQEDRVFYNARDMAVVRGQLAGFPVVLASATPSVESLVNASTGRYEHVRLESRFGNAILPELQCIDMRKNPPPRGKFISPILGDAVRETVSAGRQALLFLNRRGYAPLTLCRVCGHRFECPNCSAWLVEHRFRGVLQCHHCGEHRPTPEACEKCGTLDHLVACGPGVERLAEEAVAIFPTARIIVLSSDMVGGAKRMRVELEAIAEGQADIIIGTQLVAKGHNFPMLDLVGVVDADLGLASGDPRAAERTFQTLHQVTGRAGRAGGKSRGLLQTYQPNHPVIAGLASGDREAFYEREIDMRRMASLPPFGRLASFIISSQDRRAAESFARQVRASCPLSTDVRVLGPAPAPLSQIRGRHRFRLLVHAAREFQLQAWLRDWLAATPPARGDLRLQVDIDPQSFV